MGCSSSVQAAQPAQTGDQPAVKVKRTDANTNQLPPPEKQSHVTAAQQQPPAATTTTTTAAAESQPAVATNTNVTATTSTVAATSSNASTASAPPATAATAAATAAPKEHKEVAVVAAVLPPIPDKPKEERPLRRDGWIDRYEIIKVLGSGASCEVQSVRDKDAAGSRLFAMKVLKKEAENIKNMFENERKILATLRHQNILDLVDAWEDRKNYHILTGLCQGGELFDRVKASGAFSERSAARLAREVLLAVDYCHQNQIVHRDLKPENFVFETQAKDSNMKLIDFGCAKVVKDDEVVRDYAGSPYYVAPEVLNERWSDSRTGRVWKACDMWSVGVIIFLFVCGYPPFPGSSTNEIFKRIRRGRYYYPNPSVLTLSDSVHDLIKRCLEMEPSARITAGEALKHPWIAQCETIAPDTPLPTAVTEALGAFAQNCRLKKAVGRVLANRMTPDDRSNLAVVFKQFDKNNDGRLGPDEIQALVRHIGRPIEEAKELMAKIDDDGDGVISQDEFATASAMGHLGNNTTEIKKAFDLFDVNHDGEVTTAELEKLCEFLTPAAAKQLIGEVDANKDGKINFSEWLVAMADAEQRKKAAAIAAANSPNPPAKTIAATAATTPAPATAPEAAAPPAVTSAPAPAVAS